MKLVDTHIEFDKQTRTTYCQLISSNGEVFIGQAHCHEDDADMYSEHTGAEIAWRRAKIKVCQAVRDHEILPVLKTLKHLYNNMAKSKNFNAKSYENRMLRRQIRIFENDLLVIREEIANDRKFLKEYIAGKEKIWARIRAKNKDKIN